MTYKKMTEIVVALQRILMNDYVFCGIRINISYAARAKHSKTWCVKTHSHPWFEFNYVLRGSVCVSIEGSEFTAESGDSYIIPPGVKHSNRSTGEGDDGVCVRFGLEATDTDAEKAVEILRRPICAPFDSGIERMDTRGGIMSIKAEFAALLMHIHDKQSGAALPSMPPSHNVSEQVIMYLNEYYQTKISEKELAAALNISYRSMARNFKAETGLTVSEKLAEIRLNHAKRSLLTTKLSLYDIAVSCGYDNEFYFSRKFRQKEKLTPSEYRRRFAAGSDINDMK